MKKIISLFIFLCSLSIVAQRTCGTEKHMAEMMKNPEYKRQHQEQQSKFEIEYQRLLQEDAENQLARRKTVYATRVIPVAVHFPTVSPSSAASLKTCLRNLAQTQINVLNADFNATNLDISNWASASSFYPGVTVGNLDVQFVLATRNHPAGTGIPAGTVAVTFGTDYLVDQFQDATWAGYLNFVVTQLGDTELGVSYTPANPSLGHALKSNTFCFGKGSGCAGYVPSAPFNLGRTVTHELGHYYNLLHTFSSSCGTTAGCATSGDRVCDTPAVTFDSIGCPTIGGVVGCVSTQKVLTMNYMDYTDDACMYMFTNGQKIRALAQLNSVFSQYVTNALSTKDYNTVAFSVSPNPTNGIINIQFQNVVSDFEVEVYDATGREVAFKKLDASTEKSISLDNVAKGIYYVTISVDNTQTTRKVIVE